MVILISIAFLLIYWSKKDNDDLLQQLKVSALLDRRTGLPNRFFLEEKIDHFLRLEQEEQAGSFAVIAFMIANMEEITIVIGERFVGNIMRQEVRRFEEILRPDEILGVIRHYLVLISPGTDQKFSTIRRIKELLDKLGRRSGRYLRNYQVDYQIGYQTSHHQKTSSLLLDEALSATREVEPGKCQSYNEEMRLKRVKEIYIETELKNAIRKREMYLVFQPVMDIKRSLPIGFEALLRWKHKTRGLIPPAEFIPISENIGFISEIGDFVLTEASLFCAGLNDNRGILGPLFVSVNISALQIIKKDSCRHLLEIINRSKANPSLIHFELTETKAVSDWESTRKNLDCLRRNGAKISIDDFGTGYNSMNHLSKLNADIIKIDQSFIAEIVRDERTKRLVRGFIEFAHQLDNRVVAEGVETEEQMKLLKEWNCDYVQGFYAYAPMKQSEIKKILH